MSITRVQGRKSLSSLQRYRKKGRHFGDVAGKNEEDLNMQKHARGNSVCKGTEVMT